jgi:hypothetical protein
MKSFYAAQQIINAVRENPDTVEDWIPEVTDEMRRNRLVMEALVEINGWFIFIAAPGLRNDPALIRLAIASNPVILEEGLPIRVDGEKQFLISCTHGVSDFPIEAGDFAVLGALRDIDPEDAIASLVY